jgi:hypothetical protein
MVMPSESIFTGKYDHCFICEGQLELKVCHSAAGYYIGTWCCEPNSRESVYYRTHEEAQRDLESDTWRNR